MQQLQTVTETAGDEGAIQIYCHDCAEKVRLSNCAIPKYISSNLAWATEACPDKAWYEALTLVKQFKF